MPSSKSSRSYFKNKKPKSKKNPKKSNKSFAQKVKAVIHKQEETKQAFYKSDVNDALTTFNSYINSAGDMLQVIPNVSKGTSSNNRIGDELIVQRLTVQGHLRYTPQTTVNDAGRGNIAVRMMIVSNKIRPSYPDVNTSLSPLSQLLKKGGTTTAFSGLLSDLYAPINQDLWTKHYNKVIYLNQPMMIQPTTAGLSSGFQDLQNIIKFFKIDVKLKKKLVYDDGINGGITPTNAGPIMLIGYVYLNGATPDNVSQNVGLWYNSTMLFEG